MLVADAGNNVDVINIENVIIEIEANNQQVLDENDGGHNLVMVDVAANLVDTFDAVNDRNIVQNFKGTSCGCKGNCSGMFSAEEFVEMRYECAELDHYHGHVNKLDQVILGQLRSLTNDTTLTSRSHRKNTERKNSRTTFYLKGRPVCKNTYMFAHNIKIKRLKRLTKMYNTSGLIATAHGNTGKVKKNVTSFKDTEFVVKFLQNYAEQHAIILPGRSKTVYNTSLKLLPSSDSKVKIYDKYRASFTDEMQEKPVHQKIFTNIWRDICPDIVVMKPRSDLCAICQKHYTSGAEMASVSEEIKMQTLEKMTLHLETVAKERKHYNDTIKKTRENLENGDTSTVHYSFDMAQQVHIPSNPMQPGPIYFLVPFKVGIFGVMCETKNQQINYLIPESVSTTKGSNLIVSLFDHYLESNSSGEDVMYIHADNCVGQNKNNILMGYLAWRICEHKNKKIVLSFMPVGHTKFACDWAFGLLKKKFRVTNVSSLSDLVDCIEKSTPSKRVNSAVMVGNEKGEVALKTYDWLRFFQNHSAKKIAHITQYNHFEFSVEYKGKVHCKTELDGNEFVHQIFALQDGPHGFPDEIIPEGMTRQRREYLHKNIRQYCKEEFKDTLCPPVEPEQATEAMAAADPEPDNPAAVLGPSKKRRKRSV
ncbi:hypothetical protein J6590_108221 [Homalodisca vitripennis]|nr:hypothetical protein J6590_108221 [Homalodisca vitripennis]